MKCARGRSINRGRAANTTMTARNVLMIVAYGDRGVRSRRAAHRHIVSGTSWTALTLEVGKPPTEVTCDGNVPRSPPSATIEFASSPSCSWSLNRAVLDDGRQHGFEQDQGARARPALGACATRPGHAVNNMLAEGRRCKRHPGAASMQLHGCARHCRGCRQLCQSLCQSSQTLRAACAQGPASRTVAG